MPKMTEDQIEELLTESLERFVSSLERIAGALERLAEIAAAPPKECLPDEAY